MLGWAIQALREVSETPRLDAEVLLAHVLGTSRAAVLARPERELTPNQAEALRDAIDRRARGEPVAYLVGEKEFFGLSLCVDRRVLIPRPETETLVERALVAVPENEGGWVVADVGTGSGAIALAVAAHRPRARVHATDTSAAALEVARQNAARVLGLDWESRVRFTRGPLLAGTAERVNVVCANLPYIPTAELATLPASVREHEPWSALDGGPDGLDAYRALLRDVLTHVGERGAVLMECDPRQAPPLLEMALRELPGATGEIVRDLTGEGRVVEVHR